MKREVLLTIGHVVGIAVSSILLTGLILSAIFSIPVPAATAPSPLFGNNGILPFFASIVTIVLLSFGAWHAIRTHEHSRRAEAATRFQKGAEMLGSDSSTTQIAGLYMLYDLARDWYELYAATVINTWLEYGAEQNKAYKASLPYFGGNAPAAMPRLSEAGTMRMLSLLSQLNHNGNEAWPDRATKYHGKLLVQELFINNFARQNENYKNIYFRNIVIGRLHLIKCNLTNVQTSIYIKDQLTLDDCDLTGANLWFFDLDMKKPVIPTTTQLIIKTRFPKGAKVNGKPADIWFRE